MDFLTLDDLATWMLTNIRLSRYDNQFVNNLTLYITQHERITSNQDALFRKVALKYARQFNHYKIDITKQLINKWTVNTVESIPEYTGATIKIIDDTIVFKSPFNKNFLSALKKNPIYSLNWLRDKKVYEAKYSPTVLKQLIYLSADHFETLNYCSITSEIVNNLSTYESIKYWSPILVGKNGHYYVASINESLYNAIKDIPITNDLTYLANLASHGIAIHRDVQDEFLVRNDPEKVRIASNFLSECDIKNVEQLIGWLDEFGVDAICEPRSFVVSSLSDMYEKLEKTNIKLVRGIKECINYKKPVVLYMRGSTALIDDDKPTKLFKAIKLVNSEPIRIK